MLAQATTMSAPTRGWTASLRDFYRQHRTHGTVHVNGVDVELNAVYGTDFCKFVIGDVHEPERQCFYAKYNTKTKILHDVELLVYGNLPACRLPQTNTDLFLLKFTHALAEAIGALAVTLTDTSRCKPDGVTSVPLYYHRMITQVDAKSWFEEHGYRSINTSPRQRFEQFRNRRLCQQRTVGDLLATFHIRSDEKLQELQVTLATVVQDGRHIHVEFQRRILENKRKELREQIALLTPLEKVPMREAVLHARGKTLKYLIDVYRSEVPYNQKLMKRMQ